MIMWSTPEYTGTIMRSTPENADNNEEYTEIPRDEM